MTLREIVRKYLEENGYDGLYNSGVCACDADDLFPCSAPNGDCKAGVKEEGCSCGEGCDYHIVSRSGMPSSYVVCPHCKMKGTPFPDEDPILCGNCGGLFNRPLEVTSGE